MSQVFDFDWTVAAPGELEEGRTAPVKRLRFARGGVFNALMLTFTLQMDAHASMAHGDPQYPYDEALDSDYSSGFDNPETHWDNPIRFLPLELNVKQGDELQLLARHHVHDLDHIALHGVTEAMMASPGGVGHREMVDNEVCSQLGLSMSMKQLAV